MVFSQIKLFMPFSLNYHKLIFTLIFASKGNLLIAVIYKNLFPGFGWNKNLVFIDFYTEMCQNPYIVRGREYGHILGFDRRRILT